MPPPEACSVADYGNSFNPDSQERTLDRRERQRRPLETAWLRIINTPMGQELIAELNSFEVDFTSAGNMRVDVRSKDHHGDLVIATALALWSAVGGLLARSRSACSKTGIDLSPPSEPGSKQRARPRPYDDTRQPHSARADPGFLVSIVSLDAARHRRAVIFWPPLIRPLVATSRLTGWYIRARSLGSGGRGGTPPHRTDSRDTARASCPAGRSASSA